jgi:hypothetical protein
MKEAKAHPKPMVPLLRSLFSKGLKGKSPSKQNTPSQKSGRKKHSARRKHEKSSYSVQMLDVPRQQEDLLITSFANDIAGGLDLGESSVDEEEEVFKKKKIVNQKTALFEALFDLKLAAMDKRPTWNRPRVRVFGGRRARNKNADDEEDKEVTSLKLAIFHDLEEEMDADMEEQAEGLVYESNRD